jgi:cobalt-zinc-cadmium resistance protein CzcA
MALATGAGAEVQRPLATAVVIGMLVSTVLSLIVLPGVLRIMLSGYQPAEEGDIEDELPSSAVHPQPQPAA